MFNVVMLETYFESHCGGHKSWTSQLWTSYIERRYPRCMQQFAAETVLCKFYMVMLLK